MDEPLIRSEIVDHYGRYEEATRLASNDGALELARTQEILLRVIPPPPGCIVDVGGGRPGGLQGLGDPNRCRLWGDELLWPDQRRRRERRRRRVIEST